MQDQSMVPLTPDELLSTTRSVRRRLDFERPVKREVIEDCLRLAQQAPSASNSQRWHFVIVTDDAKRRALGDIYREQFAAYRKRADRDRAALFGEQAETNRRVVESAQYLADHLHEAPVHVLPCITPRPDRLPGHALQASIYASIIPAAWSFMLAARARGLGGSWTTLHLGREQEVAELLGIPFDSVAQVALIPIAYTLGTEFKPAPRQPLEEMVHWDAW